MFDKEFDIATLINIYQKGEIDIDSMQRLDAWLASDPANQRLLDELIQEDKLKSKVLKFKAFDQALGWEKVIAGIPEISQKFQTINKVSLWPRFFIAAAIAAVLFGAGLFFYNGARNKESVNHSYATDIAPGDVGATLTLANGKKISLKDASKGELANESGISISKTTDGQVVYEIKSKEGDSNKMNTLSTANGETYTLTLPDKTKVWLNAASSLTYAASLRVAGERKVELTGEAFFEVEKDKDHPFIVKTANQKVQVLGTRFNINSYDNEPSTKTTLLEGSVQVTSNSIIKKLKPGEQSTVGETGIRIKQVDTETVVDWRNGDFVLNGEDFKTFMRKIARWYNVEIIYDPSIPQNIEPGGWISRNKNISSVLQLIERSGQVHFKVEGRRIFVTK